jgi:hypothetical protein
MSRGTAMTPISYSIDKVLGIIFEVWRGDVTAVDLKRYWEAYLANPDVLALRRTLVDLRGANIRFTGYELSNLVSTLVLPTLKGRDWKTAIVVDRPVQYGVSRQYQVFAEQYSKDFIFSDYDKALHWLHQEGDEHRTVFVAEESNPAVEPVYGSNSRAGVDEAQKPI